MLELQDQLHVTEKMAKNLVTKIEICFQVVGRIFLLIDEHEVLYIENLKPYPEQLFKVGIFDLGELGLIQTGIDF